MASRANSITELNSSAVITKPIARISMQYSTHLKFNRIPPINAKKPANK